MTDADTIRAAEEAVQDAMIEHGPDGHIDGYEQITRAALNAIAPDRDRARSIAVALEQENAELERTKADLHTLAERRLREMARLRAEAHAAHSVIEQAGLLQEWLAAAGSVVAPRLQHILDGGTFEEARQAIYDGARRG